MVVHVPISSLSCILPQYRFCLINVCIWFFSFVGVSAVLVFILEHRVRMFGDEHHLCL